MREGTTPGLAGAPAVVPAPGGTLGTPSLPPWVVPSAHGPSGKQVATALMPDPALPKLMAFFLLLFLRLSLVNHSPVCGPGEGTQGEVAVLAELGWAGPGLGPTPSVVWPSVERVPTASETRRGVRKDPNSLCVSPASVDWPDARENPCLWL